MDAHDTPDIQIDYEKIKRQIDELDQYVNEIEADLLARSVCARINRRYSLKIFQLVQDWLRVHRPK